MGHQAGLEGLKAATHPPACSLSYHEMGLVKVFTAPLGRSSGPIGQIGKLRPSEGK